MSRKTHFFTALCVVAMANAGCRSSYPPPPVAERPASLFDTYLEVPRDRQVPVGIAFHEARLKSVESQLEPSPEAVAKARTKSPGSKRWMLLRFRYDNPGWAGRRVSLRTVLLSENGAVLAVAGLWSRLDARASDDTITVPLHIRTADWGEARRLRVSAAFVE